MGEWKKQHIKTIMGLWQLLLIDWCTATSWWLRCCVLIWIISHFKKRISAIPHTPESRRTWIKNLHVREGVNESTDVRILTSWWCVSVRVCVCAFTQVCLCEYAGPLCVITAEFPVRTFCLFAWLHTLTVFIKNCNFLSCP